MKPLQLEAFHAWLAAYGRASRENDPQASAELFARNAQYYETPFDEPMLGRDAIRKYWELGAQTLKDKNPLMRFFPYETTLALPAGSRNSPISNQAGD